MIGKIRDLRYHAAAAAAGSGYSHPTFGSRPKHDGARGPITEKLYLILRDQAALDAPPPEYAAPTYAYLAGDLAKDVTGQIFIAAGGFVGCFDRPTPTLIAYRDHNVAPPWSNAELHAQITKRGLAGESP